MFRTVVGVCLLTLTIVVPMRAVTDGELDGNRHPAVVLLLMDVDGQPAFRCSGTLLTPTILLTAGHCAGEPGEFSGMRVFTESDVQNGNNNYPFPGPNTVEAVFWAAHPAFTEAQFFLHDVGVVVLKSPGVKLDEQPATACCRGKRPARRTQAARKHDIHLCRLRRAARSMRRDGVAEKIRMFAQPHLIQMDTGFTGDASLLLSNNASTGGTCFGDSGGPNFLATSNVIAGVTSFGLNGSCGGTGGVFRLDRRDVLDFVNAYLHLIDRKRDRARGGPAFLDPLPAWHIRVRLRIGC